jgi:hypothetical protein
MPQGYQALSRRRSQRGVRAAAFEHSEAERVDRPRGNGDTTHVFAGLAEHEQRLMSAAERALVVGATNFDVADGSVHAMRKPGAAAVAFANHILRGRSSQDVDCQALSIGIQN